MKKTVLHLCLMLGFPVILSAQYSGGNGRGDAFAERTQIPVSLNEKPPLASDYLIICQNEPNPFNTSTSIHFTVYKELKLKMVLLDMFGREIKVLTERQYSPGKYTLKVDASGLQAGIYLCRTYAAGYTETKKMAVIR